MGILRGLVTARVIGARIRTLVQGNGQRARVGTGLGKRFTRAVAAFFALAVVWPASAEAIDYTFTKIADTGDPLFQQFSASVSINGKISTCSAYRLPQDSGVQLYVILKNFSCRIILWKTHANIQPQHPSIVFLDTVSISRMPSLYGEGKIMPEDEQSSALLQHTSTIVAAHVSHNAMPAADLPRLIATVHETLAKLGTEEAAPKPEPAVPIKQSVTPDYIVCLDDGKKLKMLKRHLKTAYNMTPADYRKRWGLPLDYPMVAPNYAKTRSELAKKIGLGRKPGTKSKARRKA